ncbi:tetratricopeptide repeat protein [Kyrpidia spormannii]|uniref:Uncharacterized protein n=1 Tax=Kyrpidia spormannii TaxID=2055160 RepID=A0A6F9E1H6_9BACL|nr:hypothetical protein [Kyrpidia spormannii]CAB3390354.1 conserved exported protein of unknown function [Kyrpidia spormannii]
MRYLIVLAVLALLVVGLFFGHSADQQAAFLLTVVSASATLGGIAFALYGWYSSKEIPDLVEKRVQERMNEMEKRLEKRLLAGQEAVQKVIAAYGVTGDPDRKIALLRQALEVDPSVYNGYVALGYVYWYEKGDLVAAEECFRKDLEHHPDNYQAACDLAALYVEQQEWTAALSWMKEAVRIRPESAKDFDNDPRFDALRSNRSEDYEKVLGR